MRQALVWRHGALGTANILGLAQSWDGYRHGPGATARHCAPCSDARHWRWKRQSLQAPGAEFCGQRALPRTLCRVYPAPLQAFGSAPNRWGRTTAPRGRRMAPTCSHDIEETYPRFDLSSFEGAEWTANRPAPARAPAAHCCSVLASMSQPRSSVVKTPLPATASRLDLNTYRTCRTSSKQPGAAPCRP